MTIENGEQTQFGTVTSLEEMVESFVPVKLTYSFDEGDLHPLNKIQGMLGSRYRPSLPVSKQLTEYGIEIIVDYDERVVTLTRIP
ncbi:MAG: hypothetical protein WAU07_00635 [Microgenomates group bacterium]